MYQVLIILLQSIQHMYCNGQISEMNPDTNGQTICHCQSRADDRLLELSTIDAL
jgi:hypothetical protein